MLAACWLQWCSFSDLFRNSFQVRRRRPRRLLHRLVRRWLCRRRVAHYDTFKPGTSGLPLLLDLLKQLDPETQKVLLRFAMASGVHESGTPNSLGSPKQPLIPKEQAIALIKQTISSANRPLLLEFFLHQSHVLQMIPEKWGSIWATYRP